MKALYGHVARESVRYDADERRAYALFRATLALITLLALCALFLFTGCARLQLPAIDPSGSRIFLPLPNTTQLAVPSTRSDGGFFPTPAFTTPAMPPPCVDGGSGGVCNLFDRKRALHDRLQSRFASPGAAGEIQMTPMLVVAPVGGEVVLLAGICGDNGYLVKRQPLEWMLSPDSVGTFIDVGDDSPGMLTSLLRHKQPKVEKLDVDFARGRTNAKETLITRGSPQCTDDITVKEGQSWLSISSPTEGVSRVTVLAPDSELWDHRKQTATIYWVDAQWVLPEPPAPRRAGEVVDLMTRVSRAENLVPAEGWLVHYTILDPNVARFSSEYTVVENVAKVRVDRDGQAPIKIVAGPAGRGATPVLIDIIRPAQPTDRLPELKIGSGQTMVAFSAPNLQLMTLGPEVAAPGEPLTYNASMANTGDVDIENAVLTIRKPDGWQLVGRPVPDTLGAETDTFIVWDQGVLAAGQQLDVEVTFQASRPGQYQIQFDAKGEGGLSDVKQWRTDILESTVTASFTPVGGVAEAEVGKTVLYDIGITNTSRQVLDNLTVKIEADPGLVVEATDKTTGQVQRTSRVEQSIRPLQSNETFEHSIEFMVEQTGQRNVTLSVYDGDRLLDQKTVSIQGLVEREKRSEIDVRILFPEKIQVGQKENALIRVLNPGETTLTNIAVTFQLDPSLRFSGFDVYNTNRFRTGANGTATWNAPDLLARIGDNSGDPYREVWVELECLAPVAQGTIQIRATCAEGVEKTGEVTYEAVTVSQPPAGGPVLPDASGGGNNAPRTGTLKVILDDSDDPTLVHKKMRYFLTVENNQNREDRNIQIRVQLSQGMSLNEVSSLGAIVPTTQNADGTISLQAENYVRSGERLNYTLVVTPNVAGEMSLEATVTSDAVSVGVQDRETTTARFAIQ